MKERIVLINILLALINQSYGNNKNQTLMTTIDEALELIRTPAVAGSGSDEMSLLVALKDLILELQSLGVREPYEERNIMARMRVIGIYFKEVVTMVEEHLKEIANKDKEQCDKDYYYYHSQINGFVREAKFTQIMSSFSFKLRENPDLLKNREAFIRDLNAELAPYVSAGSGFKYTDIPGIMSSIDLEDTDDLNALYNETQDLYSDLGVLKFDLQGWNDMMGNHKGLPRGMMGEIQAFSGGGKSETMRKMLTGMAICNKPHMINPNKKPLIVYLTFEDTQREAYEKMFTQLYREEHDCLIKVTDLDTKDVVKYVQDKLQAKGYRFKVIYGEKYASSPYDVVNLLEAIQNDGYEIHALGLDYMLLLNMTNVPGHLDTYRLKSSYGIVGAYCKARGITCITAAQIDDSAKYKLEEAEEFAREAVNMNLSAGSKYIIHELDFRLFVHIETSEAGEEYYHQMALGKCRFIRSMPKKLRYAVYKMHSVDGEAGGFIKPDVDGPSQVRDRTGGDLRTNGGNAIW